MKRRTDRISPGTTAPGTSGYGTTAIDAAGQAEQTGSARDRRHRLRRQVIASAAGAFVIASVALTVALLLEPDASHADNADVVFAAPASQWNAAADTSGAMAIAKSSAVRPRGADATSQGKAKRVTVTVTPGDGENLTVAEPPKGPIAKLSRGAKPDPNATVDDAWSLFQQAAKTETGAALSESPKVKTTTVAGLKTQRTVDQKAMTSTQIGNAAREAAVVVEAAEKIEAAKPAPSQDQWTLRVSGHETREAAVDAAASAHAHMVHIDPNVNVSPFIAVDNAADEAERYVALLAGFDDRQHAQQHAESLVRFGYRGQPLLVDFSSSR